MFKQILGEMDKDLLPYPVVRTINKARRDHSVCALIDGLIGAAKRRHD